MRITGDYETVGSTKYFIPDSLPPKNPELIIDAEMATLYGEAMLYLGKLNEMAHRLPDLNRFIKAYVIKEALLSSAIEGIHTTILDVFTQPLLESKPNKNTQLVLNYTQALNTALLMIKEQNMPLVSRVILAAHKELMELGEGDRANPGNYRKQSVRVGNLIPTPAQKIPDLMTDLEKYINTDETLPALIKAGLVHVQFETIHPFLDGNGRIGRLLIVLMLINADILSEPILYPSYFFKKNQLKYYQQLDRVRSEGDFESWIKFYLTAIKDSAHDAYIRAQEIEMLSNNLIKEIMHNKAMNIKAREMRVTALFILFGSPVINIRKLSSQLDVSYNTANQIIQDFIKQNILIEENQQKRGRLFRFKDYIDTLEKEY